MQTLPSFVAALLPVIGVIIGASLQYYFSKSSERRKQLELLRSQACVDYLKAIAQIAKTEATDLKKRGELLSAVADAKTRVCIYSSANVIKALAEFEKSDLLLNSTQAQQCFLKVCVEMRRQHFGRSDAAQADDLNLILFGLNKR